MSISYTTSFSDGIVFVHASGFDESVEEVKSYGMAVVAACAQTGTSLVLCDELELDYRLGIFDTYAAAEFLASQAPSISRVAIVCAERFIDDARFWENVVVNRGLTVRAFTDLEAARGWLCESPS